MSIEDLRREYQAQPLLEGEVDPDPIIQFRTWFSQALELDLKDANAMTLATATPDGKPSARIVLIKGVDERGFTFFTNYGSRKAEELAANPNASLVFYWRELDRQVRIDGVVSRVSQAESASYFASRPRGAQIGAWASEQSSIIPDRNALESEATAYEQQFDGKDVPLPANWGGYRLEPHWFEFWHGRASRLHDRLTYTRQASGEWALQRLAP